jgi:hypothetical protein
MSLSPATVAALRAAAASRADIARLLYAEREVAPGSGLPFTTRQVVVVLDDPPTERSGREVVDALLGLLGPALRDPSNVGVSVTIPSASGLACLGGDVLYDRSAP